LTHANVDLGALKLYNNVTNFSTTLTDGKICRYNSTTHKINCDYTDVVGVDTNDTARVDALYLNISAFLADTDTNDTSRVDALYNNISAFLLDTDTNDTSRVDALYLNISAFLEDDDTIFDPTGYYTSCDNTSGCGYLTEESDPDFSSWKSDYVNNITAFLADIDTNDTSRVDALYLNISAFLEDDDTIFDPTGYYTSCDNTSGCGYLTEESDPDFSSWKSDYVNNITAFLTDTNTQLSGADVVGMVGNFSAWLPDYAGNISAYLADIDTNDTTRVDALYSNISAFLEDDDTIFNPSGYFTNIANFTGTLTSSKWCVYDGSEIDCNVEPVTAFNPTGYMTALSNDTTPELTGNLDFNSKNATEVNCITFSSGGKICSGS